MRKIILAAALLTLAAPAHAGDRLCQGKIVVSKGPRLTKTGAASKRTRRSAGRSWPCAPTARLVRST
jgi:hypothetical protein